MVWFAAGAGCQRSARARGCNAARRISSGPRREAPLLAAIGVPIIPVGYNVERGKLNRGRWDLQLMPALYDEICVRLGEPLFIAPAEDIGSATQRVEIALNQLCDNIQHVAKAAIQSTD